MSDLPVDASWIKWVFTGMAGVFLGALKWIGGRLDAKLSKEVFIQYEKRQDEQHAYTQNGQIAQTKQLENQDKKLDRIFEKLDGKEDKGRH